MNQQEIEVLNAENERLRTILSDLLPEQNGRYFICGGATKLDADGLPRTIVVCPLSGVEGSAIYTQKSRYSTPDWWQARRFVEPRLLAHSRPFTPTVQ